MDKKVSLLSVHDYTEDAYSAYHEIIVDAMPDGTFEWTARIYKHQPIGHHWQGKLHAEYPADAPIPSYPSSDHLLRQDQYLKLDAAGQAAERAKQDAYRAACAKVYEAHPKPVHLVKEQMGVAKNEDDARTASQKWVMAELENHRVKPATLNSYAIPLPVDYFAGAPFKRLVRRAKGILLMALAYATTTRNNRLTQVQVGIDAGGAAGTWNIYNGTRPASGGTATTLLASLTLSHNAGAAPSGGVFTFSAITSATAVATSTATWSRIKDSTGTFVVDGDVGTSGSDLNLNSTSINSGVNVSITSATITEGNP